MPTQLEITLALDRPAPEQPETYLHGLIHRQLERSQMHLPETQRIGTQLHDSNRQTISLKLLETQPGPQQQTLRFEIQLLEDAWANGFCEAFAIGVKAGSDQPLTGLVSALRTKAWTLAQLQQQTSNAAFERLDFEFVSRTVFTHKHAPWDVPFPELLLKSLEARWGHAGGAALRPVSELMAVIDRVAYDVQRGLVIRAAKGVTMPAFTGGLRLELKGEPVACQDLATLAAFGACVNVGKRVAYGCGALRVRGQTRSRGWVALGELPALG